MFCEHEFVKQGITSICRFCGFVTNGAETIKQLQSELAAARVSMDMMNAETNCALEELAKLRALLSSARLAMRICIPKPSCHSIDVLRQIDLAIGEAGVHCAAKRGEGTK